MTDRWPRLIRWTLAAWFAVISATFIFGPAVRGNALWFGWDAVVYTQAARDLVAGGDPWLTEVFGIYFAGPPTTLLMYVPFIPVPDALVAGIWVAIGLASSIYSVRALRLPWWWVLFPPIVVGVSAGSSAPLVLALLIRAGVADDFQTAVRGASAVLLRPYAALPLLLLGRWRALALAVAGAVATAPFVAWPVFLDALPRVQQALTNQSGGGQSAAVAPWLLAIAVIGLVALGRRRAAWLIVPALWPSSQMYYASIALPVLPELPLVALAIASPATPGLIAVAIAAQAAWERLTRRPIARRWAPDALLAHRARPSAAPLGSSPRATH